MKLDNALILRNPNTAGDLLSTHQDDNYTVDQRNETYLNVKSIELLHNLHSCIAQISQMNLNELHLEREEEENGLHELARQRNGHATQPRPQVDIDLLLTHKQDAEHQDR